ncbi:MAG: peptidyl-prolyl cis-trans isomerase [Phycisphaerales bacterium]|nr:MAG: peptidyl-prolyl cis-trans isomerase [Phycisphaerales bacterium]
MRTILASLIIALGLSMLAVADEPKPPPKQPESPSTAPASPEGAEKEVPPKVTEQEKEVPVKPAPKDKPTGKPRVAMETTLGTIVLELDADKAPITVANFLRYVEDGFYEGTIFHRVMPGFMIQGGGYTPELDEKTEGLHEPIKNEARNGLRNVRGTIAAARLPTPDSATSQFYINVVDNSSRLDYPSRDGHGYAVFGKVVQGMDVVEAIRNTKTQEHPKYPSEDGAVVPVTPIVVKTVRLLDAEKGPKKPVTRPAATDKKPVPPKDTPAKPVTPPPPPPPDESPEADKEAEQAEKAEKPEAGQE